MKLFIIVILSSFASITCLASADFLGMVSKFKGSEPVLLKVKLSGIQSSQFENSYIEFDDKEVALEANREGCFCYEVDDLRFQYVHSYYYLVKQIQMYNELFEELKFSPLPKIKLKLSRGELSSGSAGNNRIEMTFGKKPLDMGQLGHELGHLIHYHLLGADRLPMEGEYTARRYAEVSGVVEGTANLLSAWFLGDPHINKTDLPEVPYDINIFVRFPTDFVSRLDYMKQVVGVQRLRTEAPSLLRSMQESIQRYERDPEFKSFLDQPFEYVSSAVINQPLWQISQSGNKVQIMKIYLKALARLKKASGYKDLAKALIVETSGLPEIQSKLISEFKLRGLEVSK